MMGQHALPGRDRNTQKRTGFGPHLRSENSSQLWQSGSPETARDAFPGGDVLRQSCGPVREQSQKADRFWSAPAERTLKPAVAMRIASDSHGSDTGMRYASAN